MDSKADLRPPKLSIQSLKDLYKAYSFSMSQVWIHHRKVMVLTVLFSSLMAVSPYLQRGVEALLINYLTNNFGSDILTSQLFLLLALVPLAILFNSLVFSLFDYWDAVGWRQMRLRSEVLFSEKLASLDVATHEDPKFKDKVQLLEEEGISFTLPNFYDKSVRNMSNMVGFVFAAIVMLQINWVVLLIVLVVSIPRFIVEMKYGDQIWSIYQSHSEAKRHLRHATRQTDSVEGVRELQTYNTTSFFINRIRRILKDFHAEQQDRSKSVLFWKLSTEILVFFAFCLIVWILIQPVLAGGIQIGTFVFMLAMSIGLQNSVLGFFLAISGQYKDSKAVNTLVEVLNQKRKIEIDKFTTRLKLDKAPEIIFENVSFAYPSNPDVYILKNFNFTINSGEKLAIVGENGAGKSTLIKLLCRFYDPTEGRVLINRIDLRDINLKDWYKHIALLAQDYQTYLLPVKELIHLGRIEDKKDGKKISDAGKKSNADEFIKKWKSTYDQQIGVEFTGGVDPSHGQKQKLALARALFREAFITILDEPTASIDAKAEQQIFEQLEKIMDEKKSLILISHRFSTVRNADKIAVIDGDSLKEFGTHEELMKLGGLYKEMYSAQAQGYKD